MELTPREKDKLLIFTAGRLTRGVAPIVPPGLAQPEGPIANPLPQALILTAIVIGFAMFSFLLVLAYRAYQTLEADDTNQMRVAEPTAEGAEGRTTEAPRLKEVGPGIVVLQKMLRPHQCPDIYRQVKCTLESENIAEESVG